MAIHSTAIIDPTAKIGQNVEIGPYCIIGADCHIGDGTRLAAHVVLEPYTRLGKECQVSSGAVLGGLPQDMKFGGEVSYVEVGDKTIIRECATINRATGEGKSTVLGNECMMMAYAHLGHNCQVGNGVILANSVQLGGHVEVGDNAFLGGIVAIHQFVRVGRLAIVGGFSGARQDIPPFAMAAGTPAHVSGINKIGLKRRGFNLEERSRIKQAFHLLWFSGMNQTQAVQAVREQLELDANIQELLSFVETSKRGITKTSKNFSGESNKDLENSLLSV